MLILCRLIKHKTPSTLLWVDGVCFFLLNWVRGSTKAYVQQKELAYQSSVEDLKTSVSNGKSAVASAITDKGVSTSATATFDTMAANIRRIKSAARFVSLGGMYANILYTAALTEPTSYSNMTISFTVPLEIYPTTDDNFEIYIQDYMRSTSPQSMEMSGTNWFAHVNNRQYATKLGSSVHLYTIKESTYNSNLYWKISNTPPVISQIRKQTYTNQHIGDPDYDAYVIDFIIKSKVWKDDTYASGTIGFLLRLNWY